MADPQDHPIYDALVIPTEALARGGIEILRAGLIMDELYVTARPTFDHPSVWGQVLAETTQRLARLYAADGKCNHKDAFAAISGAYAAALGAPGVPAKRKSSASARKTTKRKPKPAAKRAKTTARRKARR